MSTGTREKRQKPFRSSLRSTTSPGRGGFHAGKARARRHPPPGELAELAKPEGGFTVRAVQSYSFAYFSISCSQKSAVLSQLYFCRTASGAATGWAASASRSTS